MMNTIRCGDLGLSATCINTRSSWIVAAFLSHNGDLSLGSRKRQDKLNPSDDDDLWVCRKVSISRESRSI